MSLQHTMGYGKGPAFVPLVHPPGSGTPGGAQRRRSAALRPMAGFPWLCEMSPRGAARARPGRCRTAGARRWRSAAPRRRRRRTCARRRPGSGTWSASGGPRGSSLAPDQKPVPIARCCREQDERHRVMAYRGLRDLHQGHNLDSMPTRMQRKQCASGCTLCNHRPRTLWCCRRCRSTSRSKAARLWPTSTSGSSSCSRASRCASSARSPACARGAPTLGFRG